MVKNGWMERVDRVLSEQTYYTENYSEKKLAKADTDLCAILKEARNTKDVGTMLSIERGILEEEREHFSTGQPEQEKRLSNAVDAVKAIEDFLEHIASPEEYKTIAKGYKLPSEKREDIPYDSARKGFKHLEKHLKMMSSMPVGGRETLTGIINNRKINNKEMEKLYTKKQKDVLGLDFTKDKKKVEAWRDKSDYL